MKEIVLIEQEMIYRRVAKIGKKDVIISEQEWREGWVDEEGKTGDMWVEDFMTTISKYDIRQIINDEAF
jgi:hypothetical protein